MKSIILATAVAIAPLSPAAAREPQTETAAAVNRSETVLLTMIEGLRSGQVDYAAMTPAMAERVRGQQASLQPMLNGFGAVLSVEAAGVDPNAPTAEVFLVKFEKASTRWVISFDAEGKINGLGVRPAG